MTDSILKLYFSPNLLKILKYHYHLFRARTLLFDVDRGELILFWRINILYQSIKIWLIESILNNPILFEFALSFEFGFEHRDGADMIEDGMTCKFEELPEIAIPILHIHHFSIGSPTFSEVEVGIHQSIERFYMFFAQIVLRDHYITFEDFPFWSLLPSFESHKRLGTICLAVDDFCCGFPRNSPVEFILDACKKMFGNVGLCIVICRQGINISDFLVQSSLAHSDFPNSLDRKSVV